MLICCWDEGGGSTSVFSHFVRFLSVSFVFALLSQHEPSSRRDFSLSLHSAICLYVAVLFGIAAAFFLRRLLVRISQYERRQRQLGKVLVRVIDKLFFCCRISANSSKMAFFVLLVFYVLYFHNVQFWDAVVE